jgi:phosphoribosylglycinamide formyltransferase-1
MGTMTAFDDASEPEQAIQWPKPHSWSEESLGWPRLKRRLRLGVMASGHGSNFEALVGACRGGPLQADVVQLVVNNPASGALQRAERLGIACQLHDHRDHPQRQELDRQVAATFAACDVDLVVMAGWMRIVTPVLIGAYPDRLVNIHPSLLPSFRGVDAVGQALAAGVTLTGCTAHLVEEVVDAGPILVQAAVPVLQGDDQSSLTARIQAQEHRILPYAVALAALRLTPGSSAQG